MEKNANKGLIILSTILTIILIISVGYIGYLKNDKETCENDNSLINVDKSNRYAVYAENLKKSINNYNKEYYSQIHHETPAIETGYDVYLNNNNDLYIKYYDIDKLELDKKYENYHLASNVLSYFLVETGNGGLYTLYFTTEDGHVGSVDIESALKNNGGTGQLVVKENIGGLKDIVNIISIVQNVNASSSYDVVFIDINGNFYKNN